MPNGQKYEDWIKSKGSGEGGNLRTNFRETRVEEVQSRVLSMIRKLRSLLSETPFGGERIVADL
jgi:hypothetical protein